MWQHQVRRVTLGELMTYSPGGVLLLERFTIPIEVARSVVDFFGDNNPIHHDTERAKDLGFKDVVVPKSAIFGIITGLVGSYFPVGSTLRDITLKFRRQILVSREFRIRIDLVDFERGRITSCRVAVYDPERREVFILGRLAVLLPA